MKREHKTFEHLKQAYHKVLKDEDNTFQVFHEGQM